MLNFVNTERQLHKTNCERFFEYDEVQQKMFSLKLNSACKKKLSRLTFTNKSCCLMILNKISFRREKVRLINF